MFPYPSGDGLSVGHLHNYVPCDVIGRYKRMAGLQRAARDGLGRLRPAGRKRRAAQGSSHPKETVPRYAANFKRQLKSVGMRLRLDARDQFVVARVLPLDAMVLPVALQARARVPRDGLAMVVRQVPHHPRQRAGGQRMLLAAHRQPGHQEGPRAVVLQDHRLRRPLARRPRRHRLARADQADAAQLDRTLRGRGTRLPGRPAIRARKSASSPPGPTRSSACRSWCSRRSIRWSPRSPRAEQRAAVEEYVTQARRQSEIERLSTVKEKTGVFTGAYAHNRLQRQGHPDLDRRLRPDGLRHRRDHGRARRGSARLRVREKVRPRDSGGDRARRRQRAARRIAPSRDHGITINSGFLNGMKTADAITRGLQVRRGT